MALMDRTQFLTSLEATRAGKRMYLHSYFTRMEAAKSMDWLERAQACAPLLQHFIIDEPVKNGDGALLLTAT